VAEDRQILLMPEVIAASASCAMGGAVAAVGFPNIGLHGFAPKVLAHGYHGGKSLLGSRTSTGG
jgi:hypothetical protein